MSIPSPLTWHYYLLPQPKEEYFSPYVEGPHSAACLVLSQLPSNRWLLVCCLFPGSSWSPGLCVWSRGLVLFDLMLLSLWLFVLLEAIPWLQCWHSRCHVFSLRNMWSVRYDSCDRRASFLVWWWNSRPWVLLSAGSLFRWSQIPFSDGFCIDSAGLPPNRVWCWRSIMKKILTGNNVLFPFHF